MKPEDVLEKHVADNAAEEIIERTIAGAPAIVQKTYDAYTTLFTPRLPTLEQYAAEQEKSNHPSLKIEHAFLSKVQQELFSQEPDGNLKTLEKSCANVLSRMSIEDIRKLPDKIRIDMMHIIAKGIENSPVAQTQMFRLGTGYDPKEAGFIAPVSFDATRSVGLSPKLALWQQWKQQEFDGRMAVALKENPEMASIIERWKGDPNSLSVDDKIKVLNEVHKVHSETYGYNHVPIEKADLPRGIIGQAFDIKRKDNGYGLILINEKPLELLKFDSIKGIVLHESDHIAQANWHRNWRNILENDPRHDYIRRWAAFQHMLEPDGGGKPDQTFVGFSRLQFIMYHVSPHEIHAYLFHRENPGSIPVDFTKLQNDPAYKPPCLPSLCQ